MALVDEDARLQAEVDALYVGRVNLASSAGVYNAGSAGVYGELTTPETLFRALDLQQSDRFVDLGSGRGQIVLAAAMRAAGAPESSVGVEFVPSRHEAAHSAWGRCGSLAQAKSQVKCGDALGEDLSSTTKAFLCNTTFCGELNESFARAFAPDLAPKLERVGTMQPLSDTHAQAAGLVLNCVTAVKSTWAPKGTALYIYSRAGSQEGTVLPSAVVDAPAIDAMLAARREADCRAMAQADATSAGAAERGSMRTALLAASLM
eukprot:5805106-Prymnesium_polylepis.1